VEKEEAKKEVREEGEEEEEEEEKEWKKGEEWRSNGRMVWVENEMVVCACMRVEVVHLSQTYVGTGHGWM
jgi:hypothetical protein